MQKASSSTDHVQTELINNIVIRQAMRLSFHFSFFFLLHMNQTKQKQKKVQRKMIQENFHWFMENTNKSRAIKQNF